MDLIDRQAAIDALVEELAYKPEGYWDSGLNQYDVEVVLNQQPSIDVAQVLHGRWEHDGSIWRNRWFCTECGYKHFGERSAWCPNCGARMDGET